MRFYILAALLSLAASVDLDNLQFTCQPQAGCEIFNACTKSSMDKLRIQMVRDLDSRLKKTRETWQESLDGLKDQVVADSEKVILELRGELRTLVSEEVADAGKATNQSLTNIRSDITRELQKEKTSLEATIEAKSKESIRKMTFAMNRAKTVAKTENQQALGELREEMETFVTSKIREASKQWSSSIMKAKSEMTTQVNRAMNSVKADVGNLNLNVKKASIKCDSAVNKLEEKISKTLDNILKENLTRDALEEMMDEKIKAAMSKITYAMPFGFNFGGEEEVERPSNESLARRGLCKVAYGGKCFWAVVPDIASPYDLASDECLLEGGHPANIYSEEHYSKIYAYLRSLIYRSSIYIDVWTGMKIDPVSGDVTYSDDTAATFARWEPGSPATGYSFPTWKNVYLMVKKLPRSQYQGMVNSAPDNIRDAILCEI